MDDAGARKPSSCRVSPGYRYDCWPACFEAGISSGQTEDNHQQQQQCWFFFSYEYRGLRARKGVISCAIEP